MSGLGRRTAANGPGLGLDRSRVHLVTPPPATECYVQWRLLVASTHTYMLTLPLTHTLLHTHTHKPTLTHTHPHPHTHTHTHTHTLTRPHTYPLALLFYIGGCLVLWWETVILVCRWAIVAQIEAQILLVGAHSSPPGLVLLRGCRSYMFHPLSFRWDYVSYVSSLWVMFVTSSSVPTTILKMVYSINKMSRWCGSFAVVSAWVWTSQVVLGSSPPPSCFPVFGGVARSVPTRTTTTNTMVDLFPQLQNHQLQYTKSGVLKQSQYPINKMWSGVVGSWLLSPTEPLFQTQATIFPAQFWLPVYSFRGAGLRPAGASTSQSILALTQPQLLPSLAVVGAAVWV